MPNIPPGALLGLTAWAHHHGDTDMASHLASEAMDRSTALSEAAMPGLQSWLQEITSCTDGERCEI